MKIRTLAIATTDGNSQIVDPDGLAMTPAIVWIYVIALVALFWAGVGWAISSWL